MSLSVGYARFSTEQQNFDLRIRSTRAAVKGRLCKNFSGQSFRRERRPEASGAPCEIRRGWKAKQTA
jgi:DNA invertase Pin-like site-specific DNA recombinase